MNIAIILAGGKGSRTGMKRPKQYYELEGKPMINLCLETFLTHDKIDAMQIVADDRWRSYILNHMTCLTPEAEKKFKGFSNPGENRQLSIYNALVDIKKYAKDSDIVIIHDAARPFVTKTQLSLCFDNMIGHDGVLPVLPMKDTVYLGDGKIVTSLLDREKVYAGQTPELFLLGKYYEANLVLLPDHILLINGSSEPAILAGMDIAMVDGDEGNFKVTTEKDLEIFIQEGQPDTETT